MHMPAAEHAAFLASPVPGRRTRPRAETIRAMAGNDPGPTRIPPGPTTLAAVYAGAEVYVADVRRNGRAVTSC